MKYNSFQELKASTTTNKENKEVVELRHKLWKKFIQKLRKEFLKSKENDKNL